MSISVLKPNGSCDKGLRPVKHIRNHRAPWYVPAPPPTVATFVCRSCGVAVTGPLGRLDDPSALTDKALALLVPPGTYWPVAASHLPSSFQGVPEDFNGYYAVQPDALVGVGNHPDRQRWVGCCGPSGTGGPNRICDCGCEIGTERSDCLWPAAVYLNPSAVRATGADSA